MLEVAALQFVLFVSGLAYALDAQPVPASSSFVWFADSLARVMQTAPAGAAIQVRLSAARGEYEPFQLVVRAPASGLSNVNVSVSALDGPGSYVIPASLFALYREQYVSVTQGSSDPGGTNRPLGPGLYPDGLIPAIDPDTGLPPAPAPLRAFPFLVAPNLNQPVWIDLWVPRDAPAGEYRGAATITSDQGSATIPITLQVWDFELPLRPSLQSSFAVYNPGAGDIANQQVLLRHRLMPRIVNPQDASNLVANYGLNITALWIWTNATYSNCALPAPPAAADLAQEVSLNPPGTPLYVYSADEIASCSALFPALKTWAQVLHAAGVKNLITSPPIPDLLDDGSGTGRSVADIWAMLPKQLVDYASAVAAVQQKGDEVWSYTALAQDPFSPKWLLDYDPVNYRIQPGFLNQQQGLTGVLYWRVNNWGADPWNNADYTENGKPFPGEGMLVYPGDQVGTRGFAPSMRLKWLREGAEDYEYVEILKRAGRGDWALAQVRALAPDWVHWNHDPQALQDLRLRLGQEIDRLAATRSLQGGNLIRTSPGSSHSGSTSRP